jgi:hypothetical protein
LPQRREFVTSLSRSAPTQPGRDICSHSPSKASAIVRFDDEPNEALKIGGQMRTSTPSTETGRDKDV